MHHLDGATGEAEGHGPEGTLTGPIGNLIQRRPSRRDQHRARQQHGQEYLQGILHGSLLLLLTRQRHFSSGFAGGCESGAVNILRSLNFSGRFGSSRRYECSVACADREEC